MRSAFTLFLFFFIISTSTAFAQIGGLDTSFGQGGKVTTLVTFTSGGNAMALQPNGKIIVAGYAYNGATYEFALARYNSDGSIDTTFGLEGIDTTRVRSGNSIATSVAIQKDGKIVVAGRSGNLNTIVKADTAVQFAIVRYDSTGIIDSTFGTYGIVTDSIASIDDEANTMAIQPDGKILVAGFSNYGKGGVHSEFALIRLNVNGTLDTSFNKTGEVLTSLGTNNDKGYALNLLKDGKILMAGSSSDGKSLNFALVRYKANGDTDNSFNGTSVVTVDFNSNTDIAYSIGVQSTGKIILGGVTTTAGKISSFALARIDSDGSIDNNFGAAGKITTSFYGSNDEIKSIAIDTADRIIAAGFTLNTALATHQNEFALERYDSSGVADSTFGDSLGRVITGYGSTNSEANAMVVQPDGKILLGGYALTNPKEQFAMARYLVKDIVLGIVDLAAENNSLMVYPNPVQNEATLKYMLQKDETLTINLYDLTGRIVRSVINNQKRVAGSYSELLNLTPLPQGIYIVNIANNISQGLSIKIIKQ